MKLEDLLKPQIQEEFIPKEKVSNFLTSEILPEDNVLDGALPIDSVNDQLQLPDYLMNDPEVVGYPDLEMQTRIYYWVIQDFPNFLLKFSVKDFGAGRGDFYSKLPEDINYFGFETKGSLISTGKLKYPNINLIHGDFFNSNIVTDYTVCIGTLNENHGLDKWEYFNKTLNHAISTTKRAVIFILARNMDGNDSFLDYPFDELFLHLPKDVRFTIDYTLLEDIYKLTVHIGSYDN